jgi:hypothetical protein
MTYTASVTTAHKATYAEPIRLKEGEFVTIGPEDIDYPGWIWCTDNFGTSGWVPKSVLNIVDGDEHASARKEYDARELTVAVGDRLTVHFEESEWIWIETEDGRQGWVPKSCIE